MRTPAPIGGVLLVSSLAFASPALAAPTVSTVGGDTRVELSPAFTGALGSLGVHASASHPARLRGGTAAFPIPAGEIDLGTIKGEIVHTGGLDLAAGALRVNLGSFVIDTTGATPVLTGLVKVNDSVVGRLPLFDLGLSSAPTVKRNARVGQLRVGDVAVTLTGDAAAALNSVFGVSAFTAGIPIGTAHVNTWFYEPDR